MTIKENTLIGIIISNIVNEATDELLKTLSETLAKELVIFEHLSPKVSENFSELIVKNDKNHTTYIFWFNDLMIEIESIDTYAEPHDDNDDANYKYVEGPTLTVENIEKTFNKYLF